MLARVSRLCDSAMKLMGTEKLKRLADEASDAVAGSVVALVAELRAATWRSADELLLSFPSARSDGFRVVIEIDEAHSVTMMVHHHSGCILIEEAGRREIVTGPKKRKRI